MAYIGTLLQLPQNSKDGDLHISIDINMPEIPNLGYNVFAHDDIVIDIPVEKLPEMRNKDNHHFTAYTLKSINPGTRVNVGGGVRVHYNDKTMWMHGSYEEKTKTLKLS